MRSDERRGEKKMQKLKQSINVSESFPENFSFRYSVSVVSKFSIKKHFYYKLRFQQKCINCSLAMNTIAASIFTLIVFHINNLIGFIVKFFRSRYKCDRLYTISDACLHGNILCPVWIHSNLFYIIFYGMFSTSFVTTSMHILSLTERQSSSFLSTNDRAFFFE